MDGRAHQAHSTRGNHNLTITTCRAACSEVKSATLRPQQTATPMPLSCPPRWMHLVQRPCRARDVETLQIYFFSAFLLKKKPKDALVLLMSTTSSLQFHLSLEGSAAGSSPDRLPGASAPPHGPSLLEPFADIHPPHGFHEPANPPWSRPRVEPAPPSTPAVGVAVGGAVPVSLAALADEGNERDTPTDSPQTRAHTRFALKSDVEVCAATPSCFLLARDAPPPLPPPDRRSSAQWMQTMRT